MTAFHGYSPPLYDDRILSPLQPISTLFTFQRCASHFQHVFLTALHATTDTWLSLFTGSSSLLPYGVSIQPCATGFLVPAALHTALDTLASSLPSGFFFLFFTA